MITLGVGVEVKVETTRGEGRVALVTAEPQKDF